MEENQEVTPTTRDRYVHHSRETWRYLVHFVFLCPADRIGEETRNLARRIGAAEPGIRRKVEAILSSQSAGMTMNQIIEAGQSKTLSSKAERRRKENGPRGPERIISWRVSADLADAIKPDPDRVEETESLQSRAMRLLGIRTSNELWEFFNSCYADLSDAEFRNLGGAYLDKKKRLVT